MEINCPRSQPNGRGQKSDNSESLEEWNDYDHVETNIFNSHVRYEDSQRMYSQWGKSGAYDQMLNNKPDMYNALPAFTVGMEKLFDDIDKPSVRILDLGAGTGLSGEKLRDLGYRNVDGLEPNDDLVKICSQRNVHKNIIAKPIGGDVALDIPDGTYDAVCTVGAFAPGHIPCSAIPEMIRITKKGGFILNCMREEFIVNVPEYANRLVPMLDKLEEDGVLQKVAWEIYPHHYLDKNGVRMVYRVI